MYKRQAAVVGDNGENTINILAVAIADGNSQQAIRSLTRLRLEGISETQALRGTLRHLHKLHAVVAFIAAGENITQAVRRLRPLFTFQYVILFTNKLLHGRQGNYNEP